MKKYFQLMVMYLFMTLMCAEFNVSAGDVEYLISPKGVARMDITLPDGKKVDDIQHDTKSVKATKLLADMVIANDNGSTYDAAELYNGKILIKGRGNTSWNMPKKPYSIDLVMEDGKTDNPSSLLGMPADEEWAIVANYADPTMMRNSLAYYLGSMMSGIDWSPRNRFVEVYINNAYYGLYMLVEKIKRGKNRVNVSKLDMTANPSGGYVLECTPEDRVKDDERNTMFRTKNYGVNFIFNYPKPKNATPEMVTWISDYINKMEDALERRAFSEYPNYIDVAGVLDWLFLHDLGKGVDNLFHASVYVQKDKDKKLRMSAPWDFDISFGNHGGDEQHRDDGEWMLKPQWFAKMNEDPAFRKALAERFDELMPVLDKVPYIIKANYRQLTECGAYDRDHERWPDVINNKGNCNDTKTSDTMLGHVRWLLEWMESRKAWLYINYGEDEAAKCARLQNYRPVIRTASPEAFERGENNLDVNVMRGYTYVWSDGLITDNSTRQINDDKSYTVQLRDSHGHLSLPSLPIRRGEPYKESFGLSLTTDSKDIETGFDDMVSDITDGIRFVVDNFTGEIRISYPSRENSKLDVDIFDAGGRKLDSFTIETQQGLGAYSVISDKITKGLYIISVRSANGVVTRKVAL